MAETLGTMGWLRISAARRVARKQSLDEAACSALAAYLFERPESAHPQLFLNRDAKPLSITAVERLVKKHARKAGLPWVAPRVLRNTHIAHRLAAGTPVTHVREVIGHSRTAITLRYAGLAVS